MQDAHAFPLYYLLCLRVVCIYHGFVSVVQSERRGSIPDVADLGSRDITTTLTTGHLDGRLTLPLISRQYQQYLELLRVRAR